MGQHVIKQLALTDEYTFDNYYEGCNTQATAQLKSFLHAHIAQDSPQPLSEHMFYLYGEKGVGLTHILQACCHMYSQQQLPTLYIDLSSPDFLPSMLQGTDQLALICLDGVDIIWGDRDWEESLFYLCNRVKQSHCALILSSKLAPKSLVGGLADLVSRMAAMLIYQIHKLSDHDKAHALCLRAKNRGLDLHEETAYYMVLRSERDMTSLVQQLDQLDAAAWQAKRRMTLPFVKSVLGL